MEIEFCWRQIFDKQTNRPTDKQSIYIYRYTGLPTKEETVETTLNSLNITMARV